MAIDTDAEPIGASPLSLTSWRTWRAPACLGAAFCAAQVAVFAMRFGLGAMRAPPRAEFLAGLGLFFASGTLAGLFVQWLLHGTDGGWRKFVIASAALATPCAVWLSLAGGLLGPLGVLAFALAPFLVLSGFPALLRWLWLRQRQLP